MSNLLEVTAQPQESQSSAVPCEHPFLTSQGSLRHQFQRALERGSVMDAISAAKAMAGLASATH
jgi:hypothetical protein